MGHSMHLVAYTRVSTQEQGNSRNGLESQQASIRRFADADGHTVVEWFTEVASGGLGLDDRPILKSAIEVARKSPALLIVSKLDRLSRSVGFIANMMDSKVRFATVEDGLDCDPFMLHLKASFAERERKIIGERTREGLAIVKARGTPLGNALHVDPVGTRLKAAAGQRITNQRKALAFATKVEPHIRRAVASGMTYQETADELNALGVQTARSGVWCASTVCRALKTLDKRVEV